MAQYRNIIEKTSYIPAPGPQSTIFNTVKNMWARMTVCMVLRISKDLELGGIGDWRHWEQHSLFEELAMFPVGMIKPIDILDKNNKFII